MTQELIGMAHSKVSAPVRQYTAQDVSINVDGLIITGLASGTFVKCEKNEDKYIPYVGSQGEVVRAHNADPTGKITFTTEITSPSNLYLTQRANSPDLFPVKVVDMNPQSQQTAGGSECWVEKHANFERGAEVGEIEWVIYVADYEVR